MEQYVKAESDQSEETIVYHIFPTFSFSEVLFIFLPQMIFNQKITFNNSNCNYDIEDNHNHNDKR